MDKIIRVATLNNFNFTDKEFAALKPFEDKGKIFVNSNSFVEISEKYPSIITLNPYMVFTEPKGNLSNVKAFRIKVFRSNLIQYRQEIVKCINFAVSNNIPVLLTFMRFQSKKTAEKFCGDNYKEWYKWEKSYYRPLKDTQKWLKEYVLTVTPKNLVKICDESGNGCPSCMNCTKLTYGVEKVDLVSLNLSESGIKDKKGKKGLCPFKCPDCFAKKITFGYSPACDKIVKNRKQKGTLKN